MEVKLDPVRLQQTKADRNSGRTFDALVKAVLATKECEAVAFVTALDSEADRLGRDIAMICEHFGLPVEAKRSGREFKIGGSRLYILSAHYGATRGCRAHFVLDHSCVEYLSPPQFQEMLASIQYAHAGIPPGRHPVPADGRIRRRRLRSSHPLDR